MKVMARNCDECLMTDKRIVSASRAARARRAKFNEWRYVMVWVTDRAYEAQAAALGIARELRAVARPGEDILATLRKANQLPGDIGALVAVSSRQYCVHCKMPAHQSVCDRCGAEHRLSSTRQGQDDAG